MPAPRPSAQAGPGGWRRLARGFVGGSCCLFKHGLTARCQATCRLDSSDSMRRPGSRAQLKFQPHHTHVFSVDYRLFVAARTSVDSCTCTLNQLLNLKGRAGRAEQGGLVYIYT